MNDNKRQKVSKNAAARGYVAFQKAYAENYIKYSNYSHGYGESMAIMESIPDMLEATINAVIEEMDE